MFVFFIVPCDYIIACNHIFLTSSNKKKVGKKEKNDLAIKQIVYDLLLIKTEIAVQDKNIDGAKAIEKFDIVP